MPGQQRLALSGCGAAREACTPAQRTAFRPPRRRRGPTITSYVSGRDGHRDLAEKLCLRGVVGNESLHSRITISFEFTLHEVRAPAGAGREIGDSHAFCWG